MRTTVPIVGVMVKSGACQLRVPWFESRPIHFNIFSIALDYWWLLLTICETVKHVSIFGNFNIHYLILRNTTFYQNLQKLELLIKLKMQTNTYFTSNNKK